MNSNSAQAIFMVRPASFQFNAETAVSNEFQKKVATVSADNVLTIAQKEFDTMVEELRKQDIDVIVFDDQPSPPKPDAIFPNNWISLSHTGLLTLYPMKTKNRQLERQNGIAEFFQQHFEITSTLDLTNYEAQDQALEGTGSIVFDHVNRRAYACLSPRTESNILIDLCQKIGYEPIVFSSYDDKGKLIYHTNVVMCIGTGYVVIGIDSIQDEKEKQKLIKQFQTDNLEVVHLSQEQLLTSFAGNMLEVQNKNSEKFLVMSKRAHTSLTSDQIAQISQYATVLPVSIDLIEQIGGGSARCMMAEIYMQKKK